VKSTLPVRGRTVALAASAAVLVGLLLAAVDSSDARADTGGFSSEPAPAEAPVASASMDADRRTAIAPAGAPPQVAAAIAAARSSERPIGTAQPGPGAATAAGAASEPAADSAADSAAEPASDPVTDPAAEPDSDRGDESAGPSVDQEPPAR
jgi:hypothetical protein